MRPAVAQRHAESLRAAHDHIRAKFSRRTQQRQRQQVRRDRQQCPRGMGLPGERLVIENRPIRRRILHQRTKDLFVELKRPVIANDNLNVQGPRPRPRHLDRLGMAPFRNEKHIPFRLHILAEMHRLCGGRGFVEQRRIGHGQGRQVAGHRLKVEQRFEPSLRYLRLIRSVLRVPAGILQNIPLNDRRRDAIRVAHAHERPEHLVPGCDGAQLRQNGMFTQASGQTQRLLQADGRRNDIVNKGVQFGKAQIAKHLRLLLRAGADMAANKFMGCFQERNSE